MVDNISESIASNFKEYIDYKYNSVFSTGYMLASRSVEVEFQDEKFPWYALLHDPSAEMENCNKQSCLFMYDVALSNSVGSTNINCQSSKFAPNEHKSTLSSDTETQLTLQRWLLIILALAGSFAFVMPLFPYDKKNGIRVPKLSIFKISESMFHALVIADMVALCGSIIGVNLMRKKPKLAILSGYVAAVSMLFALAILALFTVIWALKQI